MRLLLARGAAALFACAALLPSGACNLFDDVVYCDEQTACASGTCVDGECRADDDDDAGRADEDGGPRDGGRAPDGGRSDGGFTGDAGTVDAGGVDGGAPADGGALLDGGGNTDGGGYTDGGDAGITDPTDGGVNDSGVADAGLVLDAGPTVPVVDVTPNPATTTDDLTAVLVTPGTGVGVTHQHRWTRNSVPQPLYDDLDVVPASATVKDDVWAVTVTAIDVSLRTAVSLPDSVEIENTRPSLAGVAWYPLRPREGDTLQAYRVGFSDPDLSDDKATTTRWLRVEDAGASYLDAGLTLDTAGRGLAMVNVEMVPDDGDLFDEPGLAVRGCARPVAARGAHWEMGDPAAFENQGRATGLSMFYDARADRLVIGMSGGFEGAVPVEYSFVHEPRFTRLAVTPPPFRFGTGDVFVPAHDHVVRLPGLTQSASQSFVEVFDTAHGCEQFRTLDVAGGPGPRAFSSSAYDPVSDRTIHFGGSEITDAGLADIGDPLGDTWSLTLQDEGTGSWQQIAGSSPPRTAANLVYDEANQRMIVYGGATGDINVDPVMKDDVRALSLTPGSETWTSVGTQSPGPGGQFAAGVAYDPVGKSLLVLGGCGASFFCASAPPNELWALSLAPGGDWVEQTLTGVAVPGAVYATTYRPADDSFYVLATPAGDTARNFMILRLQRGAGTTWSLDVVYSTLDIPQGRTRGALALTNIDNAESLVLVMGRDEEFSFESAATAFGDAWAMDLETRAWTELPQTGAPSPRHSFAYVAGYEGPDGEDRQLPMYLTGGQCPIDAVAPYEVCAGTFKIVYDEISGALVWSTPTYATGGEIGGAWGAAAANYNGGMRVMGGATTPYGVFPPTLRAFDYQLLPSSWSDAEWIGGVETAMAAPGRVGAVAVPEVNDSRVYLFGGDDGNGQAITPFGIVSQDDFTIESGWDDVIWTTPEPPPCSGHTITRVVGGAMLMLFGNCDGVDTAGAYWIECTDGTCAAADVASLIAGPAPPLRAYQMVVYRDDFERPVDDLWMIGSDFDDDDARQTWVLQDVAALSPALD